MDKIKITNVSQGSYKQEDGTYAIILHTKYGAVGVTARSLSRFLHQNPHLKKYINYDEIHAEDLIGKYIYVKRKEVEKTFDNRIYYSPQLF